MAASESFGSSGRKKDDPDPYRFTRDGDHWIVAFDGKSTLIRDLKGLHHLQRLLDRPGREYHVVDLVSLERGDTGVGEALRHDELSRTRGGDAGELLDARAKEVYRRRLNEIDEDIDEARILGDSVRAARAASEREFLVRELSRAVGMGGRDRRAGATAERARASVTRAIRNAMKVISAQHPSLSEHLDRTIRTGTYCAYMPDPRSGIAWKIK